MRVTVDSYEDLEKYTKAFADEHINLLIILGNPGLQKTTTVRKILGDSPRWIEGTVSPFRLYCELWEHRDEAFVLDDVDSLYSDKAAVRLLKCLCQTDLVKKVSWQTNASQLNKQGIPREFTTASRVIIVANEWHTLNKNVTAIQDRGVTLEFAPKAQTVYEKVCEWFKDTEILDFVKNYLNLIREPSMRHFVNAEAIKRANLDWKKALFESWGIDNRVVRVLQLKGEACFASEEDRVKKFVEEGYGSRATYFRIASELRT